MKHLLDIIRSAHSVAIITHMSADGDALGSSFALALALEQTGKKVTVFLEEPVPKMLDFHQDNTLSVRIPKRCLNLPYA